MTPKNVAHINTFTRSLRLCIGEKCMSSNHARSHHYSPQLPNIFVQRFCSFKIILTPKLFLSRT